MSEKTKTPSAIEEIGAGAARAGIMLMAALTTLGMVEMPSHSREKIVIPAQRILAFAQENNENLQANQLRREREEDTAPHIVSYAVYQRTPGRAGKI